MIENFYNLLAGNGFLRKTIEHTKCFLLDPVCAASALNDFLADPCQKRRHNERDRTKDQTGIQH